MTEYKPSIMDRVVDKLHERRQLVQRQLEKQYKRTKPFRAEPVQPEELLYIYDNMTNEDVDYAIQKYGYDAVNEWFGEMMMLKQKGGKQNG